MEDSIKKLFVVEPNKIPPTIPLFPLENVLLLPFGKLPLNIFDAFSTFYMDFYSVV